MTAARLATTGLQLFLVLSVVGLVALGVACDRAERNRRAGRCPR